MNRLQAWFYGVGLALMVGIIGVLVILGSRIAAVRLESMETAKAAVLRGSPSVRDLELQALAKKRGIDLADPMEYMKLLDETAQKRRPTPRPVSFDRNAIDVRRRIEFSSGLNASLRSDDGLLYSIAGDRDEVLVAVSLNPMSDLQLRAAGETLAANPQVSALGFAEVRIEASGHRYSKAISNPSP